MTGDSQKIKIFLSYKSDDKEAVKEVSERIEKIGVEGGEFEVFISCNDIPRSADWRCTIREELVQSHAFLLLVTDPYANMDWCMFEAGMFYDIKQQQATDGKNTSTGIFCIVSQEDGLPSPLKDLQVTIAAEADSICVLFKEIYLTSDDNQAELHRKYWWNENEEKIKKLCDEIYEIAFKHTPDNRYLVDNFIQLDINKDGELNPKICAAKLCGHSFIDGTLLREWQNKEKSVDEDWIDGVLKRCAEVQGDSYTAKDISQYEHNNKTYAPVLYKYRRSSTGKAKCKVLFIPQPDTTPITSFEQLMRELVDLINKSKDDESEESEVLFLAKTPALGFLARPLEEWNRLKKALSANRNNIKMLTYDKEKLHDFHKSLDKKYTDREEKSINQSMINDANKESEEINKKIRNYKKTSDSLPELYIFKSGKIALVIAPSFKTKNPKSKVDMFGIKTHNSEIITRADRMFHAYWPD